MWYGVLFDSSVNRNLIDFRYVKRDLVFIVRNNYCMHSHCMQIVALFGEFCQQIFVLKRVLFSNSNLCPMFNIIIHSKKFKSAWGSF